jgi:hypothetical protein
MHFHYFLSGLKDALKKVHEWPKSEREDFDEFLRKKVMEDCSGVGNDSSNSPSGKKTEYSEDDDNEHYDRV